MTEDEVTVPIPQVHTIPLTVSPIATILTFTFPHPFTVTIGHIAVLPHFHKVVLIDIALMIVGTDTGTGSDGAVCHHRTYRHPRLTVEEQLTDLTLITSEEALTAIGNMNPSLLASLTDEIKHPTILLITNLHHWVVGGTSDRKDRIDSPITDALTDKIVTDSR